MGGMAPLLNGLLLLFGVAWGYGAGRRLMARHAGITVDNVLHHAPALALPILGLLVWSVGVVAIQSCPALVWRLPLWFDFYRMHLVWGGVLLLFAFSGSLTVAVAFCTHHAKRWQLASVGVMLLLTVQGVQWQYSRPVAPRLTHVTTADGVILQSHGVSCAAAAGANIVRRLGLEKTEREMAALFGTTTRLGTSASQIMYGMRQLGIAAHKVEQSATAVTDLTVPAMLFVDHPETGPESHAVAYMARHQDMAEIWDPLQGKQWLTQVQLAQIWHGRGLTFGRAAGQP